MEGAATDNTLWLVARALHCFLAFHLYILPLPGPGGDRRDILSIGPHANAAHHCSPRGSRVPPPIPRAAAATGRQPATTTTTTDDDERERPMAQVSIVTAARRELAADALNPDAREFLPWWRLGGSRKVLSADAPEYIPGGQAAASAAAHGAVAAAPKKTGMGRRAAVSTHAVACLRRMACFLDRSCSIASPRLPQWLLLALYMCIRV